MTYLKYSGRYQGGLTPPVREDNRYRELGNLNKMIILLNTGQLPITRLETDGKVWGLVTDRRGRTGVSWVLTSPAILSSLNQSNPHPPLLSRSEFLSWILHFIQNIHQKFWVKYEKLLRRFLLLPPTSRQLNTGGHVPPSHHPLSLHHWQHSPDWTVYWALMHRWVTMGFYWEQNDTATSWWMIKVWYCEYWHCTYWYCHPS